MLDRIVHSSWPLAASSNGILLISQRMATENSQAEDSGSVLGTENGEVAFLTDGLSTASYLDLLPAFCRKLLMIGHTGIPGAQYCQQGLATPQVSPQMPHRAGPPCAMTQCLP